MKKNIETTLRRRRGPRKIKPSDLRTHTVSVRVNAAELAELDAARSCYRMERGEYLRAAGLGELPKTIPQIPEVNQQLWTELGRTGRALRELVGYISQGVRSHDVVPTIVEVQMALGNFRTYLAYGLAALETDQEDAEK